MRIIGALLFSSMFIYFMLATMQRPELHIQGEVSAVVDDWDDCEGARVRDILECYGDE